MSKSRKGTTILKRKTSSKKFSATLKRLDEWLKLNRHIGVKELMGQLNQKLQGYYGITFNSRKLKLFYVQAKRKLQMA